MSNIKYCPSLLVLILTGCSSYASESVSLTLHGYNYTNRYIDSYSINGQGGRNLFLSTSTSGGGGEVCCGSWWTNSRLPIKVKVKWVANSCEFKEYSSTGEGFSSLRNFWKEAEALITTPPPADARYLEAHIYEDGHVEAAITNTFSPPRLILPFDEETQSRTGEPYVVPMCTAAQLIDPNAYPSLTDRQLKNAGINP
ncbi:DUF3304 domain-containing protein [Iodobacter sp. CM08]|uniref:DUF3304 domain-containing protein n=1 Tax=Iodobacter sp. CM08 TaxID=3085902 RepID=UPI002981BEC6|nr:DUF3304 domain-containing protein [Iodobacter sp. CM08]MDW5418475.1 DUF3304 domain-containing protein [Iodobacter sp. CM08]